jgi:hypothetical protein
MSKADSAIKVLNTAIKRVDKGWTQNVWSFWDPVRKINFVCMEGAIYGYCDSSKHGVTPAQKEAADTCRQIIFERHGVMDIPHFNDTHGRTKDEVKEVMKLAIIRLETTPDDDDDPDLDVESLDLVQPNGG